MNSTMAALVSLIGLASASPVVAADLGYNFVELGYSRAAGVSAGPVAKLSGEFADSNVFGTVGYSRQRLDGTEAEVTVVSAGIGVAHTLADGLDLTGEAGYQQARASGESLDSYRVSAGITRAFSDRFMGSAKVNHYFGGDLDAADTTAAIGAEVSVSTLWSIAAEVERGATGEAYLLALHYNF